MKTSSELRADARYVLGGKIFEHSWMLAVVVCLIYSAISSAASSVTQSLDKTVSATNDLTTVLIVGYASIGISFVVSTLLLIPLDIGVKSYFLKLVRGKQPNIGDTFNGLRFGYGDNVVLGLMASLLVGLWSLLFIIPGIIKTYSYAMCYYIKLDHPEYGWKDCLSESERMMKGNRWRLFCLQLSFIGWMIVGALCLGVGTLWVSAYQSTAVALFYEELKEKDQLYAQL